MGFTDLYEVRVKGTIVGQETLNVFHVEKVDPLIDAGGIFVAFRDTILGNWQTAVSNAVAFQSVAIESLSDITDFNETTLIPATGNKAGEHLPAHDAYTIRFPRTRTDMRHGFKRFAGVIEVDQFNGNVGAAVLTQLNALGAAIVGTWVQDPAGTAISTCDFVIVKRIKVVDGVTGKVTYRLPKTAAEYQSYRPFTHIVNSLIRTQNTRKQV